MDQGRMIALALAQKCKPKSPSDSACVTSGTELYWSRNKRRCRVFQNQIFVQLTKVWRTTMKAKSITMGIVSLLAVAAVVTLFTPPKAQADNPVEKKTSCMVVYPDGHSRSGCDPCETPNCAACTGTAC
jgi:hypothetical protein